MEGLHDKSVNFRKFAATSVVVSFELKSRLHHRTRIDLSIWLFVSLCYPKQSNDCREKFPYTIQCSPNCRSCMFYFPLFFFCVFFFICLLISFSFFNCLVNMLLWVVVPDSEYESNYKQVG